LPFSTQSFSFSVLPETNKLDQEIQRAEFKPIPTARQYMAETTNQCGKRKKSDFFFFFFV
jgi:hypothetical protein